MCTLTTYSRSYERHFCESAIFENHHQKYISDDQYLYLQNELLANPKIGLVIKGTGVARVIYYYFYNFKRFYLLTLYVKDEVTDLSPDERLQLKYLWRYGKMSKLLLY